MDTTLNIILYIAMFVGLCAVFVGWRICQPAFYIGRIPFVSILLTTTLTAIFSTLAYAAPFYLLQGQTVGVNQTLIDLMLYGAFPLIMLALIGYVLDHVAEWPLMLLISGAACFAFACLPFAYFFTAEQMHTAWNIEPTEEVEVLPGVTPLPDPAPAFPMSNDEQNSSENDRALRKNQSSDLTGRPITPVSQTHVLPPDETNSELPVAQHFLSLQELPLEDCRHVDRPHTNRVCRKIPMIC